MANTYPVAQESYSKMELQLKICSNHYKKADYEKLIEYADNLTVMIHAYLSSWRLSWVKHSPSLKLFSLRSSAK